MRNAMVAVTLAAAMVAGLGGPARAEPPPGPAPASWQVSGRTVTWTAPQRIPAGDAALEFWAGDRRLGRPTSPDQRTFTLTVEGGGRLTGLQVRAGGRRLDAPPRARSRTGTPPVAPPAALPAAAVDPGRPGPFATVSGEYALAGVPLPDYPAPVEMTALVIAPRSAAGPRPLALFLHGRHDTCHRGADPDGLGYEWPCPPGSQPIPSYRGYRQAQELLASQGYVTVSISANGVNGQDGLNEDGGAQARSSLVRRHLDRWADWAGRGRAGAPAVVRAAPPAAMSKVFLVGHSRGGEGVNRAAMDSLTPPPRAAEGYPGRVRWTIRGTLLIGPTVFGHNPVPDVPSATILPGCDGDVADLQGQQYVDATRGVSRGRALHSAVYMVGANHNFFNTEWTPGQSAAPSVDDWPAELADPVCGPGTPTRLTAAQQQTAGATYVAAAARLFVADDDRVLPLLDGGAVRAPSAGPARVLTHAIGGARTPVVIPGRSLAVRGARLCEQVDEDPARACLPRGEYVPPSPHFVAFGDVPDEPGRYAVAMTWPAPGGTVTLRPARAAVARGGDLAMRIMVPPNTSARFAVTATDARGRRAGLGEVRVDGLPGSDVMPAYWAREVRVPLKGLTSIARLELTPRGDAGRAWLIDAWTRRAGTPDPRPVALPRVDVGSLAVDEGDAGTRTHRVPVSVRGRGAGQVRIFVIDGTTLETRSWVATVRPGDRSVPVPIRVTGNTRYGEDRFSAIGAKAVRGLVVGDFIGQAVVTDDDPAPAVTVTPVAAAVAEGGTLRWRLTLSTPADVEIFLGGPVVAPDAEPELSSTDVDPRWFTEVTGQDPLPSRPLSETFAYPYATVTPGELTADLTVPTVADDVAEPAEHLRLDLTAGSGSVELAAVTVAGRVTG